MATLADQKTEKLETFGSIPPARFGHTMTKISQSHVILFGGCIVNNGKQTITSDTYSLCLKQLKWNKLEASGTCPIP